MNMLVFSYFLSGFPSPAIKNMYPILLLFEFLSVNYERYRRVAPVWWLGLLLPVTYDSDRILEFAKMIAWL